MSAPFDPREFRRALGAFTTGVTIVTARALDGTPVGVTANSFNSVSLDPPMVLWSLARSSRSLAAFQSADHWVVHILAADQEALSNRFARSGEDKFSGVAIEAGASAAPLLKDCACRLQCKTAFTKEAAERLRARLTSSTLSLMAARAGMRLSHRSWYTASRSAVRTSGSSLASGWAELAAICESSSDRQRRTPMTSSVARE